MSITHVSAENPTRKPQARQTRTRCMYSMAKCCNVILGLGCCSRPSAFLQRPPVTQCAVTNSSSDPTQICSLLPSRPALSLAQRARLELHLSEPLPGPLHQPQASRQATSGEGGAVCVICAAPRVLQEHAAACRLPAHAPISAPSFTQHAAPSYMCAGGGHDAQHSTGTLVV